jgi:hypothetical protein
MVIEWIQRGWKRVSGEFQSAQLRPGQRVARLRRFAQVEGWQTTHRNALGWPDERYNPGLRRWEHVDFTHGGGWRPGRLERGGSHVRPL